MKRHATLIRSFFILYTFVILLLLFSAMIASVHGQNLNGLSENKKNLDHKLNGFSNYIIAGVLLLIVVIIYVLQKHLKSDIKNISSRISGIEYNNLSLLKRDEKIEDSLKKLQGAIEDLRKQTVEPKKPEITPKSQAIEQGKSEIVSKSQDTPPSRTMIEKKEAENPAQPIEPPQKLVKKTEAEILAEITESYNQVVKDPAKKDVFMQEYNPERVAVLNAMERRQDLKIPPVFRTANDGDYYSILIEFGGKYAFVPRLNLTFDETSYGPGAMSAVFDCPNYDPERIYTNIQLVKPAIFKFDSSSNQWRCMQQGRLNLERWTTKPQPVEVDLEKVKKEICDAYNAAIAEPGKRSDFLNTYKPSIRVGGKYEDGKLSLQNMQYGEYVALPIKDSIYYAVVLRFAMTNVDERLIQRVFPNYNQMVPDAKLLKPAMFEPDASRMVWELMAKGEFDLPPSLDMVTSLYNDGISDAGKREEFNQQYKPVIIGIASAGGSPTFRTMNDGDYYAVAVSDGYAVLPRFGLELNETTYGPGALVNTYELGNYDGKTRYEGMKVLAPAIFETEPSKQNWKLKNRGCLELGEIVKPAVEEATEQNKAIQEIVNKYNAIDSPDGRREFIKQHKCIYLGYNKQKNVLYTQEKESFYTYDTCYYAAAVENSPYYLVLPRFLAPKLEMIVNTSDYERISPLFDFPGYEAKETPYHNSKLIRPAIIEEEPDENGNLVWKIIERGEMDLRKGTGNQAIADTEKSSSRLGKTDLIQAQEKIKISYNEAVGDKSKRDEFKGKSKKNVDFLPTEGKFKLPILGKNRPTFKEVQAADFPYYAVEIPQDNRYALVPRFGLEIDEKRYESSIKDTFDCPDFDPKMKYSDMKVTQLAISEYDPEKKIWTLIDKGRLDLGQGKR